MYYDDDGSDGNQDIRSRVEAGAYLDYIDLLEKRVDDGAEKLISDIMHLIPSGSHFRKDPDLLVWLIVSESTDYKVPSVDPSVMSERIKGDFHQIQHSSAFSQIREMAEEVAAWKTLKSMAFRAAFSLSIIDSPTEEQISVERAKITAYAQKHKLICHETGSDDVDYHAVTNLSFTVFDAALEACANVRAEERRELDEWMLEEHDEGHVARRHRKTAGTREEFFMRLFMGAPNTLNDLYVGFLTDVRNFSEHTAMMNTYAIDGETLLGVVNRQMRIEALRRNDLTILGDYWPAPEDSRVVNAAQGRAFVGTGSAEGSFGERAQQIINLRFVSERVLDAVLAARSPKNLDKELLLEATIERLNEIPNLNFSDTQQRALAEIMLDEALDVVEASRSNPRNR
ncbi:MAG: hypothetical protein J0M34_00350 [Alphaproteobacteria bacterium]|nr:hypothetical protein [Alphaproteobacteria bacterium]